MDVDLLMDDAVMVEPMLGRRPWITGRMVESSIRKIFGPKAVNEEKKKEVKTQELKKNLGW